MLKTKSLFVFLVGGLLTAVPCQGQITAPREPAQIQLGPLSVYPSLQIVDAGRDENVFNDATAPVTDYTMTVSSRVLGVLRLGANELLFQSGNDYVWFQEFESERSSNGTYAVRFNLSASRFKPFIGADRIRSRARRSPEIDARARRIDRSLVGGLAFELTPRTAITASARVDDAKFDHGELFRGVDLGEALNRSGRGGDVGIRYAVTALTTVTVSAGYEEQTFEGSHLRDAKKYTIGPTVDFNPEAAIHGRVVAAIERFTPDDPALAERTGLAYQAILDWSLFGRTVFDLGAGHSISYSYRDTEPYYLLTNTRLTVGHPLFAGLEVYGGVNWDHMSYRWKRLAAESLGESDTVVTVKGINGGVGYDLGHGFKARVGVEKIRRRSADDPIQNYDRTRFLTTMTVGS